MKGMKRIVGVLMMLVISVVATAGGRVDEILHRGVIRVGTTGDYRPFSHKVEGGYEGYDIEVAKYMAAELGVEVEFVETSWKDLLGDLEEGKFDIAMGGITRNILRKKRAELSDPYLTYGKTPIVRREDVNRYRSLGDIDRKGVRVGVNIGGTNEEFAVANIKNAELVRYENNLDVPMAVMAGEVDVMISETPEAIYYENTYEKLASPMTDNPMTKSQLGYLIAKGEYDMVAMINFLMNDMEIKGISERLRRENM